MKVWPLVNITSLCVSNIHRVFSVWHENCNRNDSPTNLKSSYLGLLLQVLGFLCGSDGKESACRVGDLGLIPGWGGSPGEGNSNPLCLSCMGNSMDRIILVGYSPWGNNEMGTTEWRTASSKCSLSISSSYFFPVIFLSLWWRGEGGGTQIHWTWGNFCFLWALGLDGWTALNLDNGRASVRSWWGCSRSTRAQGTQRPDQSLATILALQALFWKGRQEFGHVAASSCPPWMLCACLASRNIKPAVNGLAQSLHSLHFCSCLVITLSLLWLQSRQLVRICIWHEIKLVHFNV